MLLRKSYRREKTFTVLYCSFWEKNIYKWTHTVQIHVVQESIFSYFIDRETEAQRDSVNHPVSQRKGPKDKYSLNIHNTVGTILSQNSHLEY